MVCASTDCETGLCVVLSAIVYTIYGAIGFIVQYGYKIESSVFILVIIHFP